MTQTGELDAQTINRIDQYIMGYVPYTIQKKGDTLYNIANAFKTDVWRIVTANPGINPFMLEIGQTIIVPLNYQIVPTNVPYTYDIMENNIIALKKTLPYDDV